MSPFKRGRRATAKRHAGRGRHARTIDAVMPGPRWPQTTDVPTELADRGYEFPTVTLPAARPGVGRQVLAELTAAEPLLPWEQELLANSIEPSPEAEAERAAYVRRLERSIAAVADDDTAPLDGVVIDDTPRPAQAEGLIPVPSVPFLNAGAQQPLRSGEQFPTDHDPQGEAPRALVTVGNALPDRFTAWELELLHRPDDTPASWLPRVREAETPPTQPVRRDRHHRAVFADFDNPFYIDLARMVRDTQAAAHELEAEGDAARDRLAQRMAALESAHGAFITEVAAEEYRGRLADSIRPLATPPLAPLPHRVPGVALAAAENGTRPQRTLAVAR